MTGHVDQFWRAFVLVPVRAIMGGPIQQLEAWIDTGFTGEFTIPRPTIQALGLPVAGTANAIMADGTLVKLETYSCIVEWFGATRQVEVVATNGPFPLMGIGLLGGNKLTIDYPNGTVQID